MNFQELPWRIAKPSDPSFGPYIGTYSTTISPAPLGNLVPRECRAVIKKMLEPDPRKRVGVIEILSEDWVRAIEVIPREDGAGGAPPELGGPHSGGLVNLHTVGSSSSTATIKPAAPVAVTPLSQVASPVSPVSAPSTPAIGSSPSAPSTPQL
jgi:serine/threonine protein kinase